MSSKEEYAAEMAMDLNDIAPVGIERWCKNCRTHIKHIEPKKDDVYARCGECGSKTRVK